MGQKSSSGESFPAGIIYALVSAFAFALFLPALRRFGISANAGSSILFSFLFFACGGLILFLSALIFRRKSLFSFSFAGWSKILLLSLLLCTGVSLFRSAAGYRIPETHMDLFYFCPAFFLTCFLGVFAGEKISFRALSGYLLCAAGVCVLSGVLSGEEIRFSWREGYLVGDSLLLCGAFCFACAALAAKKLVTRENALPVTAWTLLFGALSLGGILFFLKEPFAFPQNQSEWYFLAFTALMPTAFAIYAWNAALARVPLNTANALHCLIPGLSFLVSSFIFDAWTSERWMWIGVCLLAAGSLLAVFPVSGKKSSAHGTKTGKSKNSSPKKKNSASKK